MTLVANLHEGAGCHGTEQEMQQGAATPSLVMQRQHLTCSAYSFYSDKELGAVIIIPESHAQELQQ